MVNEGADNNGGFYVTDLTSCYSRDVTDYKRGIKLNRNSGIISIQDEFELKGSSTVYWIAHSTATDGLVISSDGKTATMVKNGKTFYAIIKSPVNATFEKIDRSESIINYLPVTYPIFSSIMNGKNTVNKWYGKLQVKLACPGATLMTFRIDFVESTGTSAPTLSKLENWTTEN
jgi:hypothetical protein